MNLLIPLIPVESYRSDPVGCIISQSEKGAGQADPVGIVTNKLTHNDDDSEL